MTEPFTPTTGQTSDQSLRTPEILAAVKELSKVNPLMSVFAIATSWSIIIGAVALSEWANTWWVTVPCLFVISSYQHGLLILMHDASHFRLFPGRRSNDFVSNVFLALPHFVTVEGYRLSHLLHHQYLNTDKDPDYVGRMHHRDWSFPRTPRSIAWILLKDLLGRGFFEMLGKLKRFALQASGRHMTLARNLAPKGYTQASKGLVLGFYVIVAACLIGFGLVPYFFLYWILPAFWFLPAILRHRSLSEHFGLKWNTEMNSSRNVIPHLWEKILLAPWGVNYHLNHHLFPSVPFFNLGRLEQVLRRNSTFTSGAHENKGYLAGKQAFVRDLVRENV